MSEEQTITAEDVNSMKKDELIELIEENELEVADYKHLKVDELKAAVLKVLDLAPEDVPAAKAAPKAAAKPANIYTYVGAGSSSPQVITLMGKQRFVRGQATEVTDVEILRKIAGIHTFRAGEVSAEELHEIDERGRSAEADARSRDAVAEAQYLASLDKLKRKK